MKRHLPHLALAIAVLATSVGALFIRWAHAPGPVTVFYRTALAALVTAPLFFRQSVRGEQPAAWSLTTIAPAIVGGVFIALDQAAWSTAMLATKMANATYFNSLAPLWVALFAFAVFKERLGLSFWTGLALALTGTLALLGMDLLYRPHLGAGDFYALISSFFYGGYFLVTQVGRRRLSALSYTWISTLSGAACLLLLNRVLGNAILGYSWATYLVFLGAALTSQVIGYISLGYALGHLPASLVSPSMLAKPVVVALLAFLLFGERLNAGEMIGGALVLAGIYLVNRREIRLKPVC